MASEIRDDAGAPARSDRTLGLLGATLAVSVWGSTGVLVRVIELSSTEIAVYRFAIYGACMVAFMGLRGSRLTLRALRVGLWGGIALGLDVALFFEAVKRTTIVNATVIGTLQPLVVAAYASRVEGERIDRASKLLGAVAVLAAVGVVVGSSAAPAWDPVGDLFAFGALFAWSTYFILSKRTQDRLTSTEYTAATAVITAGVNLVIGVLIGTSFGAPVGIDWLWLPVLAISAGLVGHSLMNWSLVRIPLWVGSTTTLFIPVTSAVAAWIVLDQSLTWIQVGAIAVTIASVAEILRRQSRTGPPVASARPVTPPGSTTAEGVARE